MAYVTSKTRGILAILACLLASACGGTNTDPLEYVGSVKADRSVPLSPIPNVQDGVSYQAPNQPVQAAQNVDYLNSPNLANASEPSGQAPQTGNHTLQAQQLALAQSGEVSMDQQFGFNQSASADQGAPQSQPQMKGQTEIVEDNADQPVIDGIGTDNPRLLSRGKPKAIPDQQVAYIPRFNNPVSIPQSQGGMPISEKTCRQELGRMGVQFTDLPAIQKGSQCGIDYPVSLEAINGIKIMPAATLNCAMALTFSRWTKSDLVPTARLRYFSGVKAIRQMGGYSCRRMNSNANNPWSEHAHGNAIDIGMIKLNNGDEIDVRKPSFFSFRQKGLLNSVRADSCKYFNTVLGPGDPYHGDHFHFDLRSRKTGKRYCSLN